MAEENKYKLIVIGTSAGGLHAMTFLFEQLPQDYPLPIAVVQHRLKGHRDLLEEILQTKCKVRIKQADEKETLLPGHVYIAPPDYHLLIEKDHTFSLSSDSLVRFSRPSIDVLFETAAAAYGQGLVAILLTGANSDGTAGLTMIHEQGGLTIAQDPEEAQFSYMPEAAIRAHVVRHVWPLSEIQHFLLKIGRPNP
jgi:two-component system, chemotaxis family, protein-glutamate methylesterase/glutaminase